MHYICIWEGKRIQRAIIRKVKQWGSLVDHLCMYTLNVHFVWYDQVKALGYGLCMCVVAVYICMIWVDYVKKLTGTMQESHEACKDPSDIEYTFISPQKGLRNRSNCSHGKPVGWEICKLHY